MSRFLPPPWSVEKTVDGFVVRDANNVVVSFVPYRHKGEVGLPRRPGVKRLPKKPKPISPILKKPRE
jgi:hypothetical protein